jgi:hypothetical protein
MRANRARDRTVRWTGVIVAAVMLLAVLAPAVLSATT